MEAQYFHDELYVFGKETEKDKKETEFIESLINRV